MAVCGLRVTEALEQAGRRWRPTYLCTSLAGIHAAVRAGLGIAVLPIDVCPPDFLRLNEHDGFPPLQDTEIALLKAKSALPLAANGLADHLVASVARAGSLQRH